jgi:hypothetical protein
MYQEADPDRSIRGSIARAIAASMFIGMSVFMFLVNGGFIV